MLTLLPLLKGTVVGFLIAAPVGPVGLLCIRRALADGRLAAFVAGLGAAVADTLYGAVAGMGMSLISDFLMQWRTPLSLLGGVFLLLLGWDAWRKPLTLGRAGSVHLGLVRDFTTTFVITLTNPATILAFMAVFAAMGATHLGTAEAASWLLILGVFIGSTLWWMTLSGLASAVRERFSEHWLHRLNRVSAVLLWVSGAGALLSVLF